MQVLSYAAVSMLTAFISFAIMQPSKPTSASKAQVAKVRVNNPPVQARKVDLDEQPELTKCNKHSGQTKSSYVIRLPRAPYGQAQSAAPTTKNACGSECCPNH